MRSKWIKILAAAICVVMALPAAGSAAPLELDKPCSLTVEAIKHTPGSNDEIVNDLKTANLVYDLYKVADMVDEGGYYTYQIKETSKFRELLTNQNLTKKYNPLADADGRLVVPRDGSNVNKDLWGDLAQEAAKLALNTLDTQTGGVGETGSPTQTATGLPVIGEIVGTIRPGKNAFTGPERVLYNASLGSVEPGSNPISLDAGLYLLIARGSNVDAYITSERVRSNGRDSAANPTAGEEKLVTVAYTDQHVYTFAPQLISLPTKEADANGQISTANNGDWIYNPTVHLKPEQHLRYGYLEIVKDLLTYESFAGQSEEAVFVFQVEATLGEGDQKVSVYSDVKTLTFTGTGLKSVLIDKIPVGAEVTVTEVYSGASYTLKTVGQKYYGPGVEPDGGVSPGYSTLENGPVNAVIRVNDVASVKFTNEYDHRQTSGHGVINHYEYGVNGWADDVQQQWTNPAQSNPSQGNENP